MAWSPEEISKFQDIVAQLASETHLAKPGSDEGLLPIYSLINEITGALPAESHLAEAVEAIHEMLQPMLDDAQPFDAPTIEAMQGFARWCGDALERLLNGQPVKSFLATSDKPLNPAPQLALDEPISFDDFSMDAPFDDPMPEPAALDLELDAEPESEIAIAEPEIAASFDAHFSEEDNPTWPSESIRILSKLAQQFSAELLLAEKGSDEGMLPVYSLLKDIESDFDERDVMHDALKPVLEKMDGLLDSAQAYDDYAILLLTQFNIWLESALADIRAGGEPQPFEAEPDGSLDAKPASQASAPSPAQSGDPRLALLKEFAAFDVVMDLNMAENEELLQEFHTEAVDHLGQIESAVLDLERDVASRDAINSMFRSFHTIKGVAGFLNLVPVNRLAHEIESLMDLVRNDKLGVYTGIIDLVLEAKDTVTRLIGQISAALANGVLPSQVVKVSHLMARARWASEGPDRYAEVYASENAPAAASKAPAAPAKPTAAAKAESATAPAAEKPKPAPEASDDEPSDDDIRGANAAKRKVAENATIRVNTFKLDNLMDMVGELVIVQSQLLESFRKDGTATSAHDNSALQRNMSQLSRITKELQHTSMSLRMIPIKQTFQKMGRIVRDIGAKVGKKVSFEVFGEDTELDRNVVEEIGDPLVHMVRNALDHGLEPTPEARVAAGKDECGLIALKAYHQGSNIVIELSDDGRGLDPDRILKKAISSGIVQEGEQLTRDEIYRLIFAPGFSTAEQITDISGRGVGMDVVRKNIEKLRGKIEIESELGKGSTFKILLPLTMAIVDGLVVKVGADRFILPTTSVKVALRPDASVLAKIQGNKEILNIRGKIIPLFRLHEHFAIPGATVDARNATVVIVETGGRPCGLLVDDMVSKQEVVIKSLGSMMQGIPGVSGGAILGDGTIALILDPSTLVGAA